MVVGGAANKEEEEFPVNSLWLGNLPLTRRVDFTGGEKFFT